MQQVRLAALTALVAAAALFIATSSNAQRLYGTIGVGGENSTLIEIDPMTGALISTIGSVGYTVNGLEWDPTGTVLYGTTDTRGNFNGLITIDPLTGAGTPVGVNQWGLGTGSSEAVNNLAINPLNGDAYGWWDPSVDDLVSIDLGTGIATWVGDSGVGTATLTLACDSAGTMWLVNYSLEVYTVDTITGAAAYQGLLPLSDDVGYAAHHGSFNPSTGKLYGLDTTGAGPRNLVVADLSDFSVDYIPTVDSVHTLAFRPEGSTAPVPEPSALMLLGAGALSALGFVRRRR